MRNILKTVIVIGLAVGLIAFFLRNADLGRVWASVTAARPDYLLLALGLTAVSFLIRAERWQYLLAPLGPTRFWVVFRTTVIGFGASAVLPARAGEVIRPYLLARREGLRATAAFATSCRSPPRSRGRLFLLASFVGRPRVEAKDSAVFSAIRSAAGDGAGRGGRLWGCFMAGILSDCRLVMKAEAWLPARIGRIAGLPDVREGFAVVRRPDG